MDKLKNPREHKEQVAIINKLKREGYLPFAVPNGFMAEPRVKKMFKDEGLVAGWPDFGIPIKGGKIIWVEMKVRSGGRLSPAQVDIHEKLEAIGHTVIVGYGAKDAWTKLIEIGI